MADPRILIDRDAIARRVAALGAEITRDYAGADPVVVTVLKGSFIFAADLIRAIDTPLSVDFLAVRSYGDDTVSSGVVQITADLTHSIEGRDVLIVEDIIDTGLTMRFLLDNLATRSPRSIKLAALLHKPSRTRTEVPIDYLGFTVEDVFVVGYGLDHAQHHRNYPELRVLEPDASSDGTGTT